MNSDYDLSQSNITRLYSTIMQGQAHRFTIIMVGFSKIVPQTNHDLHDSLPLFKTSSRIEEVIHSHLHAQNV
jgi:hypothetical protein